MPLHVSSTCAHHQEVKIVYTASGIITLKQVSWSKITTIQFYKFVNFFRVRLFCITINMLCHVEVMFIQLNLLESYYVYF